MSFYDQAAQAGGSGYFSAPSDGLDPNLFDGMHLKQDVGTRILGLLVGGLQRHLKLDGIEDWLHAWLAGSGITYQWHADRGNGDLDVLFGVDMPGFVHHNPDYQGVPGKSVAEYLNDTLKRKLWPDTSHVRFGSQQYEVTFFCINGEL